MRGLPIVSGLAFTLVVAAVLTHSAASLVQAAEDSAHAQPAPKPMPATGGAFGPGHDPLRPEPPPPKDAGPGITAATLVAIGSAEVEELRGAHGGGPSPFFGVVLDVTVAAASTTPILGGASVQLKMEDGVSLPLFVVCAPTQEPPLIVHQGAGGRISGWTIAIDGKTWRCGGRNGRLALRVGEGGMRLTTDPDKEWRGPLVMLFEAPAGKPRSVVVPGATVEFPQPTAPGEDSE